MAIVFPDYDHSILSVTSSILAHYGAPAPYPTLPALDALLQKSPSNVVLIIVDGLGQHSLEEHLKPDSFLRANTVDVVTSVYPSTTAAATTAHYAACSPLEHGWLGWAPYFKEYGRQVNVFQAIDSYTREKVSPPPQDVLLAYDSIFSQISRATSDSVKTISIHPYPVSPARGATMDIRSTDFAMHVSQIKKRAAVPGKKFIFAYFPEPDDTEHNTGVHSPKTANAFRDIDRQVSSLCHALQDALVIVTTDHGLIDAEPIYLRDDVALMSTLIMPPSLEGRAASFFVKPHRKSEFESLFTTHYGTSFLLLPRAEVLSSHLLGRGIAHPKTDDFLGDYLACATSTRYFVYDLPAVPHAPKYIAAHAGLTPEEMQVPVIAKET